VGSEGTIPDTGLRYPLTIFGGRSTVLEISEAEILTGLEINLFSGFHPRSYHGMAQTVFQAISLSYISLAILIYRRLSVSRRQGNKSVLALSIGGHAPPVQSGKAVYI
jgi:hypothetical protein